MLRSTILAGLVATAPAVAMAESKNYALDPGHTEVRFIWNHAGVSDQGGRWDKVEGTVVFDPDIIAATKINVTIDPNSVNTGVEGLNKHMKTADLFDTEKFPEISFTSTETVQSGPSEAQVIGDLKIKDVTLPLVLDVKLVHMGEHPLGQYIDYYKGDWVGVKATGRLLRSKYNVGYAAPLTSDLIKLEISTEMKAQ
ncbi:MAG: YceI family protein [Pseudomonadota bacterium]